MTHQKSTIVRPDLATRLLPVVGGSLDTVAPGVAARVGARLWFRLPPVPTEQRRRRREPEGGRAFTVSGDGLTVRGQVFGEASDAPGEATPTAYLVHGWGGYWQQLSALVAPLRNLGYRVVAYDAPSHGGSPAGRYGPRSTRVMEMALAHALVVEQHGSPTLTVAHSLGTMAVLWARQRHGTGLGGLVTVAASTDLEELVDAFARQTGLGRRSRAQLMDRIEATIGHPRAAFDGPALAGAVVTGDPGDPGDPGLPLLAVHDRADREAPVGVSERLVAAWPGAELVVTEGLGHRRVLWEPDVVARVTRFAADRLHVAGRSAAVP